jgi:HK97 family phage major capsid protein
MQQKVQLRELRARRSQLIKTSKTAPTKELSQLESFLRNAEFSGAAAPDELSATRRYAFSQALRLEWVRSARDRIDEELPAELRAALNVGTGAQGGFTVPIEYDRELVEANSVYGRVEALSGFFETLSGGELDVAAVVDPATQTAAQIAEFGAFPESEDTFLKYQNLTWKYGTIVKGSDEWLFDTLVDPVDFLTQRGGRAIAIAVNTKLVNGTGTGEPQGITNNTVGVTLPSGNTTTVTYDGLVDLFHSVAPPYRANGTWLMSETTLKLCRKLKDGQGLPVFPGLLDSESGQDTIFNRPVYSDPDFPVPAANAKTVAFGDFNANYLVRRVVPPSVKLLTELYAANGQTGFRIDRRVDGKIVDPAAVRLLQQSAT